MWKSDGAGMRGDAAWRARERLRRRREYGCQIAVLMVTGALLYWLVTAVDAGLAARHIRSGFDFLSTRAGFDIGETLIEFMSSDSFLKAFAVGALNTLQVSALAMVGASLLGLLVGAMCLSRHPFIRLMGVAHVEVYRNIPLLVLLFAIYVVVTELLPSGRQALHWGDWVFLSKAGLQFARPTFAWAGLTAVVAATAASLFLRAMLVKRMPGLSASAAALGCWALFALLAWVFCGVVAGWDHPQATRFALRGGAQWTPEFLSLLLGLTLFTSASIAEIVRAGVLSVPQPQWEAGMALGLSRMETFNYVVLPQSLRLAVPPLASQYMNLTKNSSLAVMVGYPDLVSVANTTINVTAQALEVVCVIMVVYLSINLCIALCMNTINRRIVGARF